MNLYKLAVSSSEIEKAFERKGLNCISELEVDGCNCSLYVKSASTESLPKWSWIIDEFDEDKNHVSTKVNPAAIVWISYNEENFVISYGSAHFAISDIIDNEFGIEFLRRIPVDTIKNAGMINPGSNQYKQIIMVRDSSDTILHSENAIEKVKLVTTDEIKDNIKLLSKNIEVGHSINLKCENKLSALVEVLKSVIEIVNTRRQLRKISKYKAITNKAQKEELFLKLKNQDIEFDLLLNDAILFGTHYLFEEDYNLSVQYGREKLEIKNMELPEGLIRNKLEKYNIEFQGQGEEYIFRKKLINCIYAELDNNIILMNGTWYQYNDDYLEYIHEFLDQSPILVDYEFNWNDSIDDVETDIKKNYKEYQYNTYQSLINDNIKLLDRKSIDGTNTEPCDLYDMEEKEAIYVKISSGTSGLTYNVNQSNYIMDNNLGLDNTLVVDGNKIEIKKVTLLFVIEKVNEYTKTEEGYIDHRNINMTGLKRDLVSWYQKAYNKKLEPKVIFAYKH
ncbi:TIGR04141 family sporadically distributed protein [Mollicutes bacterium LVI A0078]|nr:TIGR04141 family sporadically distributed protein [Mollicutes bacterium LVI A0075]WOO90187.1 TIGR04141 family sporadically distributed protein [Mollicutes bacterium LVI A0078]